MKTIILAKSFGVGFAVAVTLLTPIVATGIAVSAHIDTSKMGRLHLPTPNSDTPVLPRRVSLEDEQFPVRIDPTLPSCPDSGDGAYRFGDPSRLHCHADI